MGQVHRGWVFFVQEHDPLLFSVYSGIELQAVLRPIQTPINSIIAMAARQVAN